MSDPFAFNPLRLTWDIRQEDEGRHALDVRYRLPGDSEISLSHRFDDDIIGDPLQISGVVAMETRRVIIAFQQIVADIFTECFCVRAIV